MPYPSCFTPGKETQYPRNINPIIQHVILWDHKTPLLFNNKVSLHTYQQKQDSIIKMKFEIQNTATALSATNCGINPNEIW
jgi:hypothetical protein